MENASKALLIAAGVLIVILLIAFGMSIFNSTGDTSADAETTGKAINSKTLDAKVQAILAIIDLEDDVKFHKYISDNYVGDNMSADEVGVLCKLVIIRNQRVDGDGQSHKRIYISGYQDSPNVITWAGNLEDTLKKIKKDKKYKVQLDERASQGHGENAYSVRILEK